MERISHFEILEPLGQGGMALVFKARDVRLGRLVALKLLAPDMEAKEEARLRFLLEAKAVSALDHPNVCTLYEIGETDDGRMFLAMAYIEGGSLRDRLAEGPLEPLEAALLAAQVAEGLGAAHARGIIHRDIKPGNLLLAGDLVKIADFGVARLADQAPITRDGQALGTWSYMAPEQARGEDITTAADIWSLGVVLFEMVTGKRPFRAKSEPELIHKIQEIDPPPLGVGGPRLARIVAKALQKSPERRYASAGEMREALLDAADALAGAKEDTWREPVLPVRLEPPRLHNLPFAPLRDLLKGRSRELDALAQALAEAHLQALVLHGLGGIGKTRLAIEHAWRFGRRYSAVLFVLADSPDGLNSGLAALARTELLDLPERNLPAENEVIGAVLRWLRENQDWLLILDNVDTREARLAVTKLLPALTAGRVLITSRRRDWPAGVRRQSVDHIPRQPTAEFLLERTREDRKRAADDAEQALRLAELLDGLPLALEQAGAYIAYMQVSLAEYLAEWERESAGPLSWHDEWAMQYPASLAVTWQRSFQQLSPTAQAILRLASFLAPDPIPSEMFEIEEIIHQATALLSGETGHKVSPGKLRDELAELRSLSLISAQGRLFSVHRLMQEVIRDQIPAEKRTTWNELVLQLLRTFCPFEAQDPSTWPVWDILRPHVFQALGHAAELGGPESFSMFFVINLLAVFLYGKGLYADAEPLFRRALELSEQLFGENSIAAASQLTNLGIVFRATDRLLEAEPLFRKAVEIFESNPEALPSQKEIEFLRPGERLPEKTLPFHGLAFVHIEKQQYAEAERLLQRALTLAEEAGDQPSVAATLHTLALLLKSMGRTDEAEATIRRSLDLSLLVNGVAHPRTASKMQILAGILCDLGRPDEAEPLARKAVEIFESLLGPDHPSTQSARSDLDTLTAA